MVRKKRLDAHLAESKRSESREKARREILSGWVKVNGETIRKPSFPVSGEERISVERPGGVYVSRGGEKLEYALERFKINLSGLVAVDLGASTGGFTHCMLLHGAAFVYAVDVGYGQFDYRLRENPSVHVMERTHVKELTPAHFDRKIDFVTADLSFISLLKVFGRIVTVFPYADYLFLIKPQFEALPGEHKKGVVKDPKVHQAILLRVLIALSEQGMQIHGICPSPLKGPAGNVEFFVHGSATRGVSAVRTILEEEVSAVVAEAHASFTLPEM